MSLVTPRLYYASALILLSVSYVVYPKLRDRRLRSRASPEDTFDHPHVILNLLQLPKTLEDWRYANSDEMWSGEKIWDLLSPVLMRHQLTSWTWLGEPFAMLELRPGQERDANGFNFVGPSYNQVTISETRHRTYFCATPVNRPLRTGSGKSVMCRVVVIGNHGKNYLEALHRLATSPSTLFSDSGVLPMLKEIQWLDITFCLFPLGGVNLSEVFGDTADWNKNSVGDLMDILLQALESLAFIHEKRVTHRDAFYNNFLLEWVPESALLGKIPSRKPRVWLIDFEVAICFPEDTPYNDCVCYQPPFEDIECYRRPYFHAMVEQKPYDPFFFDLWSLCYYFSFINTSIPQLDTLVHDLASKRTAVAAHAALSSLIASIPPHDLLVQAGYTRLEDSGRDDPNDYPDHISHLVRRDL